MIRFDELLCGGAFRLFEGERLDVGQPEPTPRVAANLPKLKVGVGAGAEATLVLLYDRPLTASVEVELGEGARLELCALFTAEAFVELAVRQKGRSECRMTTLQLTGSNLVCRVGLEEPGASNRLHGAFLAGAGEHCVADIRLDHAAADCSSESYVKGVASGDGVGEFRGLVYVAPDAQRTDARQTSRNVVLGDAARVTTRPQLEIYADDVKCSHGATVGQMDDEALLYMRQRGLSEAQARALQMEGFVADVVRRCGVEQLHEVLMRGVCEKLERM